MEEYIAINPGYIICDGEKRFRVLTIMKGLIVLCLMNVSKLTLSTLTVTEALQKISSGILLVIADEPQMVIDMERLSQSVRDAYELKVRFVMEIKAYYGPDYLRLKDPGDKEVLNQLIEANGFSRTTALKIIRSFLQGGESTMALIDGRVFGKSHAKGRRYSVKTGCPSVTGILLTDEDIKNFDEAIAYYKSGRSKTIIAAFRKMSFDHYSKVEIEEGGGVRQTLRPVSERPTERQFRWYIKKRCSQEDLDAIKTSKREQRNDRRLLKSDNLFGVRGPGDLVEMDEVEVDLALVSRLDHNKVVGRPIVYLMVDVYSRMILAYYVGFDNNSIFGLKHCLLSLQEDKVERCRRFDIETSAEDWPHNVLPSRVRCDYGTEYVSKAAERIFNELGITRELVPPGSGSLKGQVEQMFHQLHADIKPVLEGKGLIQKRYDSNHHQSAVLDIDDFEKLLLRFIVAHNRMHMADYPLTKKMLDKGLGVSPKEIWNYGCEEHGKPRGIVDRNQFFYTLLTPVKVSISKKGITYKGLYYINEEDTALLKEMYNAGGKKKSREMRINTQDMGFLYYIDDNGELAIAELNCQRTGNDFRGYSKQEYEEYLEKKKAIRKAGRDNAEEIKTLLQGELKRDIDSVIRKNKGKGIREARKMEKRDKRKDYDIGAALQLSMKELKTPVENDVPENDLMGNRIESFLSMMESEDEIC